MFTCHIHIKSFSSVWWLRKLSKNKESYKTKFKVVLCLLEFIRGKKNSPYQQIWNIWNPNMKGFSFLGFQVTKQSRHTQLKDFLPFPFLSQIFKATQTIRSSYTSHITHHTHVYARKWTEKVETEVKQEKIEFFSLTGFVFLVPLLTSTIHGFAKPERVSVRE